MEEHLRLKQLSNTTPPGVLQITADAEPDAAEGTALTFMHGVAVSEGTDIPDDLHALDVGAGSWAVFTSDGPHPQALQQTWAATAADWFPSNPWRLRPGPSIVSILEHDDGFTTARCDLWQPVERA